MDVVDLARMDNIDWNIISFLTFMNTKCVPFTFPLVIDVFLHATGTLRFLISMYVAYAKAGRPRNFFPIVVAWRFLRELVNETICANGLLLIKSVDMYDTWRYKRYSILAFYKREDGDDIFRAYKRYVQNFLDVEIAILENPVPESSDMYSDEPQLATETFAYDVLELLVKVGEVHLITNYFTVNPGGQEIIEQIAAAIKARLRYKIICEFFNTYNTQKAERVEVRWCRQMFLGESMERVYSFMESTYRGDTQKKILDLCKVLAKSYLVRK